MEMMARNMLKMFGIEPEALIKEFGGRVSQFEEGLQKLTNHLESIDKRLSNIENEIGITNDTAKRFPRIDPESGEARILRE